jgi:hypothetical protein
MIVPESTDLSWNWNSASLQTGEIRGSMDTKKLQIKRAIQIFYSKLTLNISIYVYGHKQ